MVELQQLVEGEESTNEDESHSEDSFDELIQIRANEPERYEDSVRQKFITQVITNLEEQFPQPDLLCWTQD